MLLAIDVGNTNTVFAVHDGAGFAATWRIRTEGRRTADEYFVWLKQLMIHQNIALDDIEGMIIGATAPQTLFNLRRLGRTYFDCEPLIIGDPGVVINVPVEYDNPSGIGADRLLNALAAYQTYGPNLIVVDFGTATTFDIVNERGAYIGGIIAPGVRIAAEALYQAASKLPRVDIDKPARVIGKDTVPGMQSGLFWGYVSLIEGLVRRIENELDREMTVIGTGGLSPIFAQGTELFAHVDPDLTLRGLVEVYRRNVGRPSDVGD
ncbi:MAG: type III pantothenate kinase [Neomegalonema sp.]|nr:type III pantothenate kinase [Neomegalonema sp.]